MKTNKNPTVIYSVDDILKCFCDDDGHILVDENCDPNLIQDLNKYKTIPNKFKLIKTDLTCPHCESTLHYHDIANFNLNKSVPMLKIVYKCGNADCGRSVRPTWDRYINPNFNYTNFMMDISLELSLIDNISYEKQSEIIKLFTGVDISRNRLYEYAKKNFDEFVYKHNKIIEEGIKKQNIKFSKVICYDEQYVLENDKWVYKMMCLDPTTKYIYDFKVVRRENFNVETVVNFLKPHVEENKIKIMSGDGSKINKKACEILNIELDLCGFHEMQNFMKLINGPMRGLNQKRISEGNKIEKNDKKINEIEKSRKGKRGRTKKDDNKAKKLVSDKRKYKTQNSESRYKIKEYSDEIQSFIDAKDAVSQCINSKTYSGGINRYNRIIDNIKKFPEKTHSYIKNMKKRLDSLLMHTKYKDAPTTNNGIELAHRHTMDGREKRKYKTIEGIDREMELKKIRWNKRCVLGWV